MAGWNLRMPNFLQVSNYSLKPNFLVSAPKQFFKGVAHEQLRSPTVCLLVGSSIVSYDFLGISVINPFIPFFEAEVPYLVFILKPQNAQFPPRIKLIIKAQSNKGEDLF